MIIKTSTLIDPTYMGGKTSTRNPSSMSVRKYRKSQQPLDISFEQILTAKYAS